MEGVKKFLKKEGIPILAFAAIIMCLITQCKNAGAQVSEGPGRGNGPNTCHIHKRSLNRTCDDVDCIYDKGWLMRLNASIHTTNHCTASPRNWDRWHKIPPTDLFDENGKHRIYDANGIPIEYHPYNVYETSYGEYFRLSIDRRVVIVQEATASDIDEKWARHGLRPGFYSKRQAEAYKSYINNSVCIVTVEERYSRAIEKYLGFHYENIWQHVADKTGVDLDQFDEKELCYLQRELVIALSGEVSDKGLIKQYGVCDKRRGDYSLFSCLLYKGTRFVMAYYGSQALTAAFASVPLTEVELINRAEVIWLNSPSDIQLVGGDWSINSRKGIALVYTHYFGNGNNPVEPESGWVGVVWKILQFIAAVGSLGKEVYDFFSDDDKEEKEEPDKPDQQEEEKPKCNPEYQTCGREGGLRLL